MDASIKQLISEEAAKIIVEYNFEKIKSDIVSATYLTRFDQNILAANDIKLIRAPFGIQFIIYKEQSGVCICVDSNYTLKRLPDSS